MMRMSDKRLVRRILFGKIGLLVLFIIFVLFAKGTWSVYQKARFAKENQIQAEQELKSLYDHETTLSAELNKLNTPRGLEEEIRHKFDVGREGEEMIVLVDTPAAEVQEEPKTVSTWEKIVSFFGFK